MSIEIKIPVHPAVPKFLAYSYNTTPFLVCTGLNSRISPYGLVLYHFLIRDQHKLIKDETPIDLAIYSAELRLKISEYTYQHKGWCLQPRKVIEFNRMVLYFIYQDFCQYMDVQIAKGEKIYISIIAYREKYDLLEEDLAVKTLEKKYERYRKDLKSLKSDRKY